MVGAWPEEQGPPHNLAPQGASFGMAAAYLRAAPAGLVQGGQHRGKTSG